MFKNLQHYFTDLKQTFTKVHEPKKNLRKVHKQIKIVKRRGDKGEGVPADTVH